ncbi:MAG: N-acetylmuramoyl-L-alanine amidase [Clostridia bacterium]|nr:N-acetylmuramoyl-L-alanine amidase [Clostridia bacterium]
MFLVVEKRKLWIILIAILVLCIICVTAYSLFCFVPKREFLVVIDAGHGGSDGGVLGVESGISEAEINLLVAYNLKTELESMNVRVVLTRKGASVLEGENGTKQDDFDKRKSIILESKPDAVISIHQNKFPDGTRRGAQVFYNANSDRGIELAKATQEKLNQLNDQYVGRSFSALKGDYYILNCSSYPSCIVECGFLSNEEDEKLLLSEEYRQKLTKTIANGVYAYLTERASI